MAANALASAGTTLAAVMNSLQGADVQPTAVQMKAINDALAADTARVQLSGQIATVRYIGVDVPALKSRLHRARNALRAELEPYVRTERSVTTKPGPAAARDVRCPDTAGMLSRYLEGEISPAVCARLERHVSGCTACGATCEALRTTLVQCRAWRDEPVPAEVGEKVRRALRELIGTPARRSASG